MPNQKHFGLTPNSRLIWLAVYNLPLFILLVLHQKNQTNVLQLSGGLLLPCCQLSQEFHHLSWIPQGVEGIALFGYR